MGLVSKSTALAVLLLCASTTSFAVELEELTGTWRGSYNINIGGDREVVLILSQNGDTISGHFEDPSNGVFGIAVETISVENDEIRFAIPRIDGNYYGTIHADRAADGHPVRIDGDWSQVGEFMPITLYRDIAP
ncbi:MAG: hypothetical protein R3332_11145 [Pseudohongiellaceae bacterium]|nr:hypothetical protein [Pseudohongiellaceae bacterium]